MTKLTPSQITKAVQKSARKYGYSAATIRTCTSLLLRAIREYQWDTQR